jgi:ribose transport system substrate-binding protein
MDGFKEAIAGTPGLKIVASQPANWNRADGQRVAEGMLTAHTETSILYGDYDEMVLGGLVIVRDRGLKNTVHIVGFGAEKDGVTAVKNGDLAATITVQEYGTGFDIIDAVNNFCVKGVDIPKVIYREPKVIDPTNIDQLDMEQYNTAN